jgi:hypothetical protein
MRRFLSARSAGNHQYSRDDHRSADPRRYTQIKEGPAAEVTSKLLDEDSTKAVERHPKAEKLARARQLSPLVA